MSVCFRYNAGMVTINNYEQLIGEINTNTYKIIEEKMSLLTDQMTAGFAFLDQKIDATAADLRKEMHDRFDRLDKKLDFIKFNHGARIELLEDKNK